MVKTMTLAFVFSAALASAQTRTLKVLPPPADVAAAPADATKTASGLASRVITPGTGTAHPDKADLVTVHYTGWTTDGKMFDSSVSAGKEVTFPLDRVIAGWTEGVQLMVAGEKRRLLDSRGARLQGTARASERHAGVRRRADQVHRIADEGARRCQEGARGRHAHVERPGLQGPHARDRHAASEVEQHGDGELLRLDDAKASCSTAPSCEATPITFRLDEVIQGWTEGVQLMVEGEKTRFWIPERLAYKGQGAGQR